ncbi:MAG TPA: molybdenum ABC transporter ATP-binding protein [Blastocatellia bacterium]|nr:molybdenum ABC transporter ATP-binding protein [Blastocatellia bacterium]
MLSVRLKKQLGRLAAMDAAGSSPSGPFADGFALDVEFAAPAGVTILFGPSGSGKTTVLRCIAGIVRPESGSIAIDDTLLFCSSRGIDLPVRMRGVGYVFQNLALFPHLTALGNIEFGIGGLDRHTRRQRALELMEALKIQHTAGRRPSEISGGEAQRVALARALAVRPRLLLLDEPLSAIDESTKTGIIADLRDVNRDLKLPVIYVTHSRDEAVSLGERILIMDHGKIVAAGEPLEVFGTPVSKRVARLTGVENIFEGRVNNTNSLAGTTSVTVTDKYGSCEIEAPAINREPGETLTIAVRSGDILLATSEMRNTSARNILPGKISSIDRASDRTLVNVASGVNWVVSVTREASVELGLTEGQHVWIAFKTYSCHILDE